MGRRYARRRLCAIASRNGRGRAARLRDSLRTAGIEHAQVQRPCVQVNADVGCGGPGQVTHDEASRARGAGTFISIQALHLTRPAGRCFEIHSSPSGPGR